MFRERDLPKESNPDKHTGTERADRSRASMCGKGTEKNQMAARLDVRLRRPFLGDLGRSGRNKGSSTWKKVKV